MLRVGIGQPLQCYGACAGRGWIFRNKLEIRVDLGLTDAVMSWTGFHPVWDKKVEKNPS